MNRWVLQYVPQLLCQTTCIVLMLSGMKVARAAEIPPIRWWGELGYDFRVEQFEAGDDLSEHAGLLRLNAASFIHEPWFATIEGGIGFNLRRARVGDNDVDSDSLLGNAKLRLFPRSRFPFETFFERADSRTDTDLAGLDIERTRYGFLQRYNTLGGAAYRLGYEHSSQTNSVSGLSNQARDRRDVTDLVRAGFDKAFGAHAIHFDSSATNVDRVDSPDYTRTLFSALRHNYRPGPSLSAEDMLTYNRTDIRQGASEFETGIVQLNSHAFWRPKPAGPLRVNATLRALTRRNESRSDDASVHSGTSTLGMTYEWSPRWLFNSGVGVTVTDNERDRSTASFQTASLAYRSRTWHPAGFDANWFGQLDARNNTDDEGDVQSGGVEMGYYVGRNMLSNGHSSLRTDWRQSLSLVEDTDGFASQRLLSNLATTWNHRAGPVSSMIRLSASDTHTWASGEDAETVQGDFQLVNFQASLDRRLSGTSSLFGNVTVQATRSYSPRMDGTNDATNGEWTPTATADITYQKRMLFGVSRLSFRSTARFISDSYLPILDEPDGERARDDRQWENRLEYAIGRLQLRAIARISEIRGEDQTLFLFQARRLFGDLQ